MGDQAEFVNSGGYNGEGLFEEEYEVTYNEDSFKQPSAKRKVIDPRDGMTAEELHADFLENGFL